MVSRVQLRRERGAIQPAVLELETIQQPASLQVDDILRRMVELGAQYADVVDFLRKADQRGCLSCPLRRDMLPEGIAVDVLADAGSDASLLRD